eukprot:365380-Chlamydomonas_euryale.AAC.3
MHGLRAHGNQHKAIRRPLHAHCDRQSAMHGLRAHGAQHKAIRRPLHVHCGRESAMHGLRAPGTQHQATRGPLHVHNKQTHHEPVHAYADSGFLLEREQWS